jgi:S1-C subfamily serine protease
MIGRLQKSRVEVYGVRTTSGIRRILSEANRGADLELDFNWKMKEDSDHWSFYSRSLPVLMFHTGLHADYHRPSDDAHRVNVEGMQQVSRLVFQTVDQLANRDTLGKFRETSRRESTETRARFELPVSNHQTRIGIAWKAQGDPPVFGVLSVTPGSPAEKAGVLAGDQLLKLQGRAITDDKQLRLELHSTTETVTFDIQRAGRAEPLQIDVEPAGKPVRVGITWRDDPAEPGATMITQVIHGSAAYYAGLQVRDRVYSINGQEFKTSAEFAALLAGQPSPLEVLYDRNGRMRTVSVPLFTAP